MYRQLAPIILLTISNIFMTFAWYGHLKLQESKIISDSINTNGASKSINDAHSFASPMAIKYIMQSYNVIKSIFTKENLTDFPKNATYFAI